MNLEEELAAVLASKIQEEIDWEIICDMLKQAGWHQVRAREETNDVKQWCADNVNGQYEARGKIWLFQDEKDAAFFSLKWS